jgi:hypothetical protein
MIEIVRGRTWKLQHTVLENEGGPLADLSHITEWRSQIREKTAVKNRRGQFAHKLVANVTITESNSVLTASLTRAGTAAIDIGDYLISIVGSTDTEDEVFLDPEPVKVVNGPTSSFYDDAIPEEVPVLVPDFSDEFNTALND